MYAKFTSMNKYSWKICIFSHIS